VVLPEFIPHEVVRRMVAETAELVALAHRSESQFSATPNGVQEPQVLRFPPPFAAQLRAG